MDNEQATFYLSKLIGKNLRISTTDSRVFGGQMKCTDQERNVILALTQEYRQPSEEEIRRKIQESGNTSAQVPWSSRYVGLVVVPGKYITKIEYEESQYGRDGFVP